MNNIIKNLVINDYFTPNIKAEVVLDTLLTPYIDSIVQKQTGLDIKFVTKEMSILINNGNKLSGKKIDYIYGDKNNIYLIELKTCQNSFDKKQVLFYVDKCKNKKFGEVLGIQLINILAKKDVYNITEYNSIDRDILTKRLCKNELYELSMLFKKIVALNAITHPYTDIAIDFIKTNKLHGSKKYIFTLAQLIDYINKYGSIWFNDLKLIYITPYALSYNIDDDTGFIVRTSSNTTISIINTINTIDYTDNYFNTLKDIINAIYCTG